MKRFVTFLLGMFLFSACVKNNPKPVYLSIENWTLLKNTDPDAEDAGELTKNLTDAWVYVDRKLIGVFELPCKIPVLVGTGSKEIYIYPTIRNNGISATKKIYPFCEPYVVTMDVAEGGTYTVKPVTQYYTQCQFWIEDFEDPSVKIETDASSTTLLNRENDPAIGLSHFYGHIALDSDHYSWLGITLGEMVLPKSGHEVYLEIDYRNTADLLTGLMAYTGGTPQDNPDISLNSQPEGQTKWKKIYIDLKELVSYSISADYFKIYLSSILNDGSTAGDIYIDNIKIIHV